MYRVLASVCKYLSITNGFSWKPESGVSSTYPTILSIGKFGINITEFISCIRWEEHRWYLLLNFFSCFKWKYLLHFFLHLWLLVLDLLGRIIWKWKFFLSSSPQLFSFHTNALIVEGEGGRGRAPPIFVLRWNIICESLNIRGWGGEGGVIFKKMHRYLFSHTIIESVLETHYKNQIFHECVAFYNG